MVLADTVITVSSPLVASTSSVLVTLTTQDASGPVFESGVTVVFSNVGGTSTGSFGAVTDHHDGTYTALFTGATAGTATTVHATVNGKNVTGALPTITVSGSPATHLVFTTTPSTTGNTDSPLAQQPVITAEDASNGVATSYLSAVTLTAYSDTGCSVSVTGGITATTNPLNASGGVASFSGVKILKTNVQSIKASDGTFSVCFNTLVISPGAISSIAFTTQPAPTSTTTDNAFTTQPVITAYDANSNVVTSDSTSSVVLTANDTAGCTGASVAGGLSGTTTKTLASGVGTYTNVKAIKPSVKALVATLGAKTACSSTLTIGVGVPASITVASGNGQSAGRGSTLGSAFVAVVKDANSNVIPNVQVDWTVASGGGSLSSASNNTDASGNSSSTLTLGPAMGSNTATATVNSNGALNVTFTATGNAIPFAQTWPFTAGTDASYSFDTTKIDFTGGVCELTGTNQTDNSNNPAGFGSANLSGAAWDTTNLYVRLSNNGCDGTQTNCNPDDEFSSGWTPQYASIVYYLKANGAGNYPSSATATDKGTETCTGPGAATVAYTTAGKLQSALSLTSGAGLTCTDATLKTIGTNITIAGWIKQVDGTPVSGAPLISLTDGTTGWKIQRNGTGSILYIRADTSGQANINNSASGPAALNGKWHHVAFVLAAGTLSQYLDGNYISGTTFTQGAGFSSAAASLTISALDTVGGSTTLDDWAIWNTNLTGPEIATIYNRQKSLRAGVVTSRVMNALATGQSWTTLSWVPTLPFFKSLPDYTTSIQNETSTSYPSLVGASGAVGDNNLMNGIVGLWHLDETVGGTAPGGKDITDRSGQGNHGTKTGTVTMGQTGVLKYASSFDGSTGYYTVADAPSLHLTTLTVSAWVNYTLITAQQWQGIVNKNGISDFTMAVGGTNGPGKAAFYLVGANGTNSGNLLSSANINDGTWHHLVGTFDGTTARFYVDGIENASSTTLTGGAVHTSNSPLMIGAYTTLNKFFSGSIDEVAIWNTALQASEVLQLYRRGANRIKYQVRICTANDCSDDAAGANWKGPDGTKQTYFSELYSMSTQSATPSGTVLASGPSMYFPNFTAPIGTSQYFQYRSILESDDNGNACSYGSGATWCSPELASVKVDPIHYDTTIPTVVGKTGVSFVTLSNHIETLGAGGCAGGMGYNLGVGASSAAATWYYWNGAAWVTANGTYAQSNPASVIATNASSFAGVAGTGTVYFKAFLKSDGTQACQIDKLELDGTN